ncbi:MAG: hypothetical protein JWO35_509, partial [Candidatus Saccharibacteria bacterium]|nr:hypothetical protein [Candidatus Saccharibacteria bacterium]
STTNTSGTVGFFTRDNSTSTLQPSTGSDNIRTTGTGTITSAGLLTASNGLSVTGAGVTITPSTNSAVGLTVNGTSGTAATAVSIVQASAASNLSLSNTGATSSNLISLTQSNSAFTGNAILLNLANGSGSFASGNFVDFQKGGTSQFSVDNAGVVRHLGDLAINTNKFTVAGVSGNTGIAGTLGVSSKTTLSGTGSTQLQTSGAPAVSAGSSLIQFSNSALAGGAASSASGTYIGINAPSSGAGSAADFLNLQNNGTVALRVNSAGLLNAAGGFAMGTDNGITSNCSGGQVLSGAVYNGGIVTGGTCSSPSGFVTLQNAYDNSGSSNPQIVLNTTYGGLKIADNATTAVTGNLFKVTNANDTSTYFGVSSSGLTTVGNIAVSGTATSSIAGRLNLTASSGVGLAVTSDATIAGSLTVGGSSQFQVDSSGNTTIAGTGSLTVGPDASHRFAVTSGGVVNDTYASSSTNTTAANFNVTNSASGTGSVTVNGVGIALTGTSNGVGGANTINGINFVGVTPIIRNTFNALNFGTGYDKLINNANYSITGAGAVSQASSLTILGGGAGITGALTQAGGAVSLNTTGSTTTSIATGTNSGTIDIGNSASQAITIQSGSTLAINTTNFDIDTAGNTSTIGTLAVGTTSQFQITNTGNVSTSGTLQLTGTGANQLKLSGVPGALTGSSLVQLGSAAITGGAAGGTYIGIRAPGSNTADFLNFQDNAGTSQLQVSSSGAVTTNGALTVLNGGATISGALSASTTVNAGGSYKIGGGVGTAGQFLRSDGSTGFVASTLQSSDGAGVFIQKVPTSTANNTIAPTAASVVALTVQGTTAGGTNILEIFSSSVASPIRQAYFDANGSLNVSQLIQATANNALDFGTSTNNFRTGYLGTKLYVPAIATLDAATANGITIQPGTSTTGAGAATALSGGNASTAGQAGGSVTVDGGTAGAGGTNGAVNIGTTNARTITLGNTNTSTVATFSAGNYGIKITNTGIGINTGAVTPTVDLAFGGDAARTISVQAQPTTNTVGNGLTVQAGAGNGTGNGANLTLQGGAKGASGTTAGFVVAKANATDGTAFQVQNAAGTALLTADTSAKIIKIGTGSPTLSSGTSGDLFVTGSIEALKAVLIGTSTDGNSFDATTHELTLAGTARHTTTVNLIPEYPGAVLTGDGSNNLGTMTSDFCSGSSRLNIPASSNPCGSAEEHNYYSWTASATNDYDIYVRYQLPSDFAAFSASNPITMYGWATNTSTDSVALSMYNGGTLCGGATTITTSNAAWTSTSLGGYSAGNFGSCTTVSSSPTGTNIGPGSIVIFKIHMNVGTTNNFARAGEMTVNYLSKY